MEEQTHRSYEIFEKQRYFSYSVSMTADLLDRLNRYCRQEERGRSFIIRKALDSYLKERGF